MDGNLNIIGLEYDIVWGDKVANIANIKDALAAISPSVDIVILPELFSTGFIVDANDAANLAERNTENTINELQQLASKHYIAIAGSYLARTAGKLYNRAFFIEPNGDCIFYDKRHLFRMGGERNVYSEGDRQSPVIRFRGWNIKLVVCYDLRFPAWCRNTDRANYDLLIVVANWPKARTEAWTTLLKARAIENECYVCGINRRGIDKFEIDYASSSSAIIDFKGNIVAQPNEKSFMTSILKMDKLQDFRKKFPAWMDADDFDIRL